MSDDIRVEQKVRVGTMGWGYGDWLGVLYPAGTPSREYIRHYARAFDMVEIDSTFYGTPRETQVRQWEQMTADNFQFCPKVPRLITHEMRLRVPDTIEPLAGFVRTMGLLGRKRGPMLLQMPPDFTRAELDNLRGFLPALDALSDRDECKIGGEKPRFVIEFRHRSMLSTDVAHLLTDYGVTQALTDFDYMPRRFELTTNLLYLRLIGKHGTYPNHDRLYGDRTGDIRRWVDEILAHRQTLEEVYIQCNNDYEGYSPATANKVKEMFGLPIHNPLTEIQGTLF